MGLTFQWFMGVATGLVIGAAVTRFACRYGWHPRRNPEGKIYMWFR